MANVTAGRRILGRRSEVVDPGAVMIDDHHEAWRRRCVGQRRRLIRRPAGALQEMAQIDHRIGADILAVRLLHGEALAPHGEIDFAIVALIGGPDALEKGDVYKRQGDGRW